MSRCHSRAPAFGRNSLSNPQYGQRMIEFVAGAIEFRFQLSTPFVDWPRRRQIRRAEPSSNPRYQAQRRPRSCTCPAAPALRRMYFGLETHVSLVRRSRPLVVSASKVYSGLGADIVYGIITIRQSAGQIQGSILTSLWTVISITPSRSYLQHNLCRTLGIAIQDLDDWTRTLG